MKRLLVTLAAALLIVPAFAQDTEPERKWAVVEFSTNFMREEPDYAAENGDQALMGTVVEIIGERGYWKHIVSPEPYSAWVNEMGGAILEEGWMINDSIYYPHDSVNYDGGIKHTAIYYATNHCGTTTTFTSLFTTCSGYLLQRTSNPQYTFYYKTKIYKPFPKLVKVRSG